MWEAVRIITLYGTPWRAEAPTTDHRPLTDDLRLGRLAPFYQEFAAQLPRVLVSQPLDPAQASFRRWRGAPPAEARLWQFGLPSGQVVLGLVLDVAEDLRALGDLIRDCAAGELTVGGMAVGELAARGAAGRGERAELTRDRYQIVVAPNPPADPKAALGGLLTRVAASYGDEPGAVSYPERLNQRSGTVAAITPDVTVLCGQPEYVVDAAFVTAAQALANLARLHDIRAALYRDLHRFWSVDHSAQDTRTRRATLERITHHLARLELDLTVAVEAPTDLGTLVPSGLVMEYHQRLHSWLGIPSLADNTTRMLRRLESTGRAEVAAVASIERRADEDRHQRWAVGVGFVSAVAIPLSLILAFFSAEASEIDGSQSMFHSGYLWIYGVVGLLVLIAVGLGVGTFLAQRKRARQATQVFR